METLVHDSLIRKHSCALFTGMKYDVPLDEHDKEWCRIHDAEDYLINKDGRVYSFKTLKVMKPFKGTSGYQTIGLMINNKQRHKRIHRLIAEAFIPNPCGFPFVDHIDINKLNNSIDNLRWITKSGNNRNTNLVKRNLPRGVFYNKSSKINPYRVQINLGETIYLGSYKTPEEASNAYKSAHEELMKQFNKTT